MTEPLQDPGKIHGSMDESLLMRRLAEQKAEIVDALEIVKLSAEEMRQQFHQLRIHQVELERQNEELRRLREDLETSRARYSSLYNSAPVGCFTISAKGLIVEANHTAATLLGTNLSAMLKWPFASFIHEEDHDAYYSHRRLLLETAQPQACELRMLRVGREKFWARLELVRTADDDHASVCRIVMSDISVHKRGELERQVNEARVQHLNDVLLAMGKVRSVLNREKDPLKLLRGVCDSLVQTRGYVMVWVGRTEEGSKRIVPVAHSGGGAKFLQHATITWDDGPTGQGPAGKAIRERCPAVFADLANDSRYAAWKDMAVANGVASIAAVPLIHRERLFGILSVKADRPQAFDAEEVALLEGLAADIAHGLQSLEDELARRKVENELSAQKDILEKIFENAPYILMLVDIDGRILKINRTCLAFSGRTEDMIPGHRPGEVINCINSFVGSGCMRNPQCASCQVRSSVMHTFETGESTYNIESHYTVRRGGEDIAVDVLISTTIVKDSGSNTVLVSITDITERKKTAVALRENEERLRLLIEHAPIELAMFDSAMRYLSCSCKWLEDFGLGNRDLTGLCFYEVCPCLPERWKQVHRRALAGEVLKADEDLLEMGDGSVKWIRWEVRPWRDAAGDVGGIVIFSEDITELRRARHLLGVERDLALKLAATGNLAEAMEHLLSACLEFEELDSGGVYLFDQETGGLKLVCYRGFNDSFAKKMSFLEPLAPQANSVMQQVEPYYWSKPISFWGFDELIAKEGLTAMGCLPVRYQGGVVAQLYLCSHALPEIPPRLRVALEHIFSHIGGVVERVGLAETIRSQREDLKDANGALKLLLKQREMDRDELEEAFVANVKNLVLPYLGKLKKTRLDSDQKSYLALLETYLLEISSPFAKRISAPLLGLTPMEIRVADLIRQGLSSKEIADLLRISEFGVIFHRQNIRGKLRLTGKKLNLQIFLNTLTKL
ncbi:MAG: PAS domain S-box protein [Syntrophobacteraceae bacterium]|nr:PAS domain S-box protein [Syntrophobacteraceae bacterium]